MIPRKRYLDSISPFMDKPVIKVITGIRRCGKSTFMGQLVAELKNRGILSENIITINKEFFEFDFIQDYKDLHRYVSGKTKAKNQKHYLFVDEVQEISNWERAIVSFLAEKKYDIYISGSNASLMSSELATLLTGRYIEFRMYPLSFQEFKDLYANKRENDAAIFADYVKYGGFPGIHELNWEEQSLRQYLESLHSTVVLKDIVMRNQIKDVSMLSSILFFIAENCGNITTAKSIRDYSKSQNRMVSTDTVLNYLHYAMDAFLIHKVRRFDVQGKRHLETFEKYYLCDTGIALATVGNKPTLLSGQLENIVLTELLSRRYSVSIGKNKEKEIDFIAVRGNEKLYIQVCKTLLPDGVIEREYGSFLGLNDHYPKLVLSLDTIDFGINKDGVKWMNIIDFILQLDIHTGVV